MATVRQENEAREAHANRDPISGEPGAHPVGTGLGAAGTGAVGAAIGVVAGPVGALAGAAVGAIIGGLAGKGVAEAIDPTSEAEAFRESLATRPYYKMEYDFDRDYKPAYRHGAAAGLAHGVAGDAATAGSSDHYLQYEEKIRQEWAEQRSESRLGYDEARPAIREAFDRVSQRLTPREAANAAERDLREIGELREADDRSWQRSAEYTGNQFGMGGSAVSGHSGIWSPPGYDEAYYRDTFSTRQYYGTDARYEDYGPAYVYGHDAARRYKGQAFEDVEADLARDWERAKGKSRLTWERAKVAAREAWGRVRS